MSLEMSSVSPNDCAVRRTPRLVRCVFEILPDAAQAPLSVQPLLTLRSLVLRGPATSSILAYVVMPARAGGPETGGPLSKSKRPHEPPALR